MDLELSKLFDELRDILKGQGEIKADISGLRAGLEELKTAQQVYQVTNERDHKGMLETIKSDIKSDKEDRAREVEAIWNEIGMLKGSHAEHERFFNQMRGIKVLLWVLLPGMIIVFGKFIIVNFSSIFGIFLD